MIESFLIINNTGKLRLSKFYRDLTSELKKKIPVEIFDMIQRNDSKTTNFLPFDEVLKGSKLVYRQYSNLYLVMIVDDEESELGILDLIHLIVDGLDKMFDNVWELDILFNPDKVCLFLDEIIVGGQVVELSLNDALEAFGLDLSKQTKPK
mmetsp:Transcript_20749/g.23989  ORF Transcript_20749/g.23989 Transcript_20749/m.23989 type:complete len:151 (-) Transcript_20749:437-889(-)